MASNNAKTSKTARASVRAGSGSGKNADSSWGENGIIIPCNRGLHAYVRTRDARNLHMSTSTDEFITLTVELDKGSGRVRRELVAFTERYPDHVWGDILTRFDAAVAAEAVGAAAE